MAKKKTTTRKKTSRRTSTKSSGGTKKQTTRRSSEASEDETPKRKPKAPQKRSFRTIGFDDENVQSGYGDKIDRYRVEKGRTDIIHILTPPVEFYGYYLPAGPDDEEGKPSKVFWINASFSPEAYQEGDTEAMEADDMMYAAGNEPIARYACVVAVLASKKGRKNYEKKVEFKVWVFAANIYEELRDLSAELPSGKDMRSFDLRISGKDTQYQKCSIHVQHDKTLLTKQIVQDFIDDYMTEDHDGTLNMLPENCTLILEATEPATEREMKDSMRRSEHLVSSGNDGGGKRRRKKSRDMDDDEEDGDVDDDSDEEYEDDDEEGEYEDEEEDEVDGDEVDSVLGMLD